MKILPERFIGKFIDDLNKPQKTDAERGDLIGRVCFVVGAIFAGIALLNGIFALSAGAVLIGTELLLFNHTIIHVKHEEKFLRENQFALPMGPIANPAARFANRFLPIFANSNTKSFTPAERKFIYRNTIFASQF